jgi:Variant SH3 domain
LQFRSKYVLSAINPFSLFNHDKEYETSDEKLRTNLPPIIAAAFSLLPQLLTTQIMIQNNLLGNYYTQLHNYCTEEGFPSPPPPVTEIISVWQSDFTTLQQQVETGFQCIAGGKAVRQPLKQERQSSLAVSNGNGAPRINTRGISPKPSVSPARSDPIPPSPNYDTKPSPVGDPEYITRISSYPSQGSLALATPNYGTSENSPAGDMLSPHAPAGPRADYFSRDRNVSSSTPLAAAAAQKKRPPPPPPKRSTSSQVEWVTALYDFAGQGHGDLAFREGDRIKVIKKTESKNDWWEGELGGVRGPFPANYCKA